MSIAPPQASLIKADLSVRDDAELLATYVANRDEAAFTALVLRYERMVWRVCRHVLHQWRDAEDATLEVFMVLMRRASDLQPGKPLACWLYGVACRVARNVWRGNERRHEEETFETPEIVEIADPLEDVVFHELEDLVTATAEALPEKLHLVFVCCCLEGMSKSEAAQKLG